MNLKLIFFIFLIVIPINLFSQTKEVFLPLKKNNTCMIFSSFTGKAISTFPCEDIGNQSYHLIPVKEKKKWGFMNSNGKWEIPPEYDFADSFYRNLARVRKENKFGYINSKNEVIIPFQYLSAGNFTEDLAPAQCENRFYGYINQRGEFIIPCRFQIAFEFYGGIARIMKNDVFSFILKTYPKEQNYFRLATDFGYNRTFVLPYNRKSFFLINHKSNFLKELNPNWIPFSYSIDTPLAAFQNLQTGWYGYLDIEGKIKIPPIFLSAEKFYLGFAKVKGPSSFQSISETYDYLHVYQKGEFEEFYISSDGKRITFYP